MKKWLKEDYCERKDWIPKSWQQDQGFTICPICGEMHGNSNSPTPCYHCWEFFCKKYCSNPHQYCNCRHYFTGPILPANWFRRKLIDPTNKNIIPPKGISRDGKRSYLSDWQE
jgi:hypothetical protein